jgi:hypothetical protein
MGKILAIVALLVLLATLPVPALAEEPAKYSFATAQSSKDLKITPGTEGVGIIYFYNIDGNRITHVSLEISQAPDDWGIEIQPPMGDTLVEIGGSKVSVTENLYVEPSELMLDEPENVPQGMVSIIVSNRGYAMAKAANIIIQVPETAEIGTQVGITISSVAEWLGQTGTAAIRQARDFDFSVEVVAEVTGDNEKIVEENGGFSSIIMRWLPTIVAIVLVVLAVVLIPLWVRKRRE